MKYIKQYEYVIDNNILKDLKKLGTSLLYHAIKSDRAIVALTENKLGGYSFQRAWEGGKRLKDDDINYEKSDYLRGISTSRDIEYCAKWNDVIFVFDRKKIKDKYKILPYNWGYSIGHGYNQGSNVKREREEFIITGFNENIKKDPKNLKFQKMISKPNGYIEPLDKYLIGFFISDYVGEYMNDDIKQQLQSHPKYLGVYIEERSKNKKLSIKDKIKNAFSKKMLESVNDDLIGKYVICDEQDTPDDLRNFLLNNIGRVREKVGSKSFQVKYEKIPIELEDYLIPYRVMRKNEIIKSSNSLKELKMILDQNKYNL